MTRIRSWALWQLPLAARILVLCVITGYLVALGWTWVHLLGASGQAAGGYLPQVLLTCAFVGAAVLLVLMEHVFPEDRAEVGADAAAAVDPATA